MSGLWKLIFVHIRPLQTYVTFSHGNKEEHWNKSKYGGGKERKIGEEFECLIKKTKSWTRQWLGIHRSLKFTLSSDPSPKLNVRTLIKRKFPEFP